MRSGQPDTVPDEGEERVRQPVQPAEIPHPVAAGEMKVEPDIKEFVDTEAGKAVRPEPIGGHILSADVVVTLERSNSPANWAIGNSHTRLTVNYSNPGAGHYSSPKRSEIAAPESPRSRAPRHEGWHDSQPFRTRASICDHRSVLSYRWHWLMPLLW